MDILSLAVLAAALGAQEAPVPAQSPAIDPDASCVAAIMPGNIVLRSISRLHTPDEEFAERQENLAIAYYLGALRSRYHDAARIDGEIAAAMTSFRPYGPDVRFERANSCVADANGRLGSLDRAFPIHRVNALIGPRSSGRGE